MSAGSGGTKTDHTDGYTYHAFTAVGSNTFTVLEEGMFEYLVVSGGGAGGNDSYSAAGGGAGWALLGASYLGVGSYTAVVGAGGQAQAAGTYDYYAPDEAFGQSSSFNGLIVAGGAAGKGATTTSQLIAGNAGACGAGGQGGTGGDSYGGASLYADDSTYGWGGRGNSNSTASNQGGGGGGMGGNGGDVSALSATGGDGGIGTAVFSDWGEATGTGEDNGSGVYYYCGGGGGAGTTPGAAGLGGGGVGDVSEGSAGSGLANTGGGGGGAGGAGGSGVVIIRYLTP